MPTKTFLNLPDEKKKHLLDSAIKEFTKHTLMEASINQIIQEAKIPRGSYYQYFENKEDLYFYTFDTVKENIIEGLRKKIDKKDNISETFLKIYDFLYHYIVDSNHEEYYRNLMITFHKLEVKPNEKEFFFNEIIIQTIKEKLKLSDEEAIDLLDVMSFILTKSIIGSLKNKHEQPMIRQRFIRLLELFKNGYEEEIE